MMVGFGSGQEVWWVGEGNWIYSSFSDRQRAKIEAHRWEGESTTDTFFRLVTHLKRAIAAGSAPVFPDLLNENPRHSFWYSKEVSLAAAGIRRASVQVSSLKRAIVWALELPVQPPVTNPDELLGIIQQEFRGEFQVPVTCFLDFVRLYTPVKRTIAFTSGILGELKARKGVIPVAAKRGTAQVTIPLPELPLLTASEVRRLLCLSPRGKRVGEIVDFVDSLPVQVLKKDGAIAGVLYPRRLVPGRIELEEQEEVILEDYTLPHFGALWKRLNNGDRRSLREQKIVLLRIRNGQEIYYIAPEVYLGRLAARTGKSSARRPPSTP